MLTRPHFEGVERLLAATEVPVIASGGVASVEDVERLGECGADAVIIGKALYEKRFTLARRWRWPGGIRRGWRRRRKARARKTDTTP